MAPLWAWSAVALVLSAVPYIASDEGQCSSVSGLSSGACSCVFPDGTGFDLSPASGSTVVGIETTSSRNATAGLISMNKYYFHPCKDVTMVWPDELLENHCKEHFGICRHVHNVNLATAGTTQTYTETQRLETLGHNDKATIKANGRAIVYTNDPSDTIVYLQCSPLAEQDLLFVVNEDDPKNVSLIYVSRHACLKEIVAVSHRSTGSTLLIVFFTLLTFYVVLGVCTKKFLMGAQGLEIIPNLGFWVDLPNLVKEGWVFLVSGCRVPARSAAGPTTSPDPNSYDSI